MLLLVGFEGIVSNDGDGSEAFYLNIIDPIGGTMISFSSGCFVVFTVADGTLLNEVSVGVTAGATGIEASLNISWSFWNWRFDASFRSAGPATTVLGGSIVAPGKALIWGGPPTPSIMKSPTLLMTSLDYLAVSAELSTSGDEESELDFFTD